VNPGSGGPLHGLRVIDCSRGTAGPRLSGLLADYGADVIWVEPPAGSPDRERLAVEYSVFNRGKRSMVIDLTSSAGQLEVLDLIGAADVFIESWRPGKSATFGLDWASVHSRAPHVVHCSITGFGADGPLATVPGYEAIVHALAGTMGEQVGHRDGPIYEGLPFAAIGASYLAAVGVLAALYRRESDGHGRHVETSLLDGALSYLAMLWGDTDVGGAPHTPGRIRLIAGTFRCGDDEYIGVHTGAVGAFGRLMTVLGLADRIPPSANGMDMGVPLEPEQADLLQREIHPIFASAPRDVWLKRLLEADICAVPHLHPGEVFDEPQAIHNEMVVRVDDPGLGPVDQVAPAAKFRLTPGGVRGPAPTIGQHDGLGTATGVARIEPPSAEPDTRPLLHDVHVLDLGAYYAGPYSSRLLADLGADVIKLEPLAGDQLRGLARPFRAAQAGKRAIALNLKDPDLDEARIALLRWADVVHHNMRPGAAERIGVSYDDVAAANPEAIYLYAPGWGSTGPDRLRQSFAPKMSGYVGVGFEVAGAFNEPLFPVGNEDPGNGLLGAVAILMGLLHRTRTGRGQYIENPQLNATMAHLAHIVRTPDGEALGAGRLDTLQHGISPLDRLYETADGWIVIVAVRDGHIAALGKVLGVEILGDQRFATAEQRAANEWDLAELIGGVLSTAPTATWIERLGAAGVPAAEPLPHNNVAFMRDPENRRTGRVAEVAHPRDGQVRELDQLVRISDAAVPPHRLAPELGEHTDDVLESVGYDPARIAALRERGSAR